MTWAEALAVMNLSGGASGDEVRAAYLKLLRLHKPEQDPEAFKRLRAAYELLSREQHLDDDDEGDDLATDSQSEETDAFRDLQRVLTATERHPAALVRRLHVLDRFLAHFPTHAEATALMVEALLDFDDREQAHALVQNFTTSRFDPDGALAFIRQLLVLGLEEEGKLALSTFLQRHHDSPQAEPVWRWALNEFPRAIANYRLESAPSWLGLETLCRCFLELSHRKEPFVAAALMKRVLLNTKRDELVQHEVLLVQTLETFTREFSPVALELATLLHAETGGAASASHLATVQAGGASARDNADTRRALLDEMLATCSTDAERLKRIASFQTEFPLDETLVEMHAKALHAAGLTSQASAVLFAYLSVHGDDARALPLWSWVLSELPHVSSSLVERLPAQLDTSRVISACERAASQHLAFQESASLLGKLLVRERAEELHQNRRRVVRLIFQLGAERLLLVAFRLADSLAALVESPETRLLSEWAAARTSQLSNEQLIQYALVIWKQNLPEDEIDGAINAIRELARLPVAYVDAPRQPQPAPASFSTFSLPVETPRPAAPRTDGLTPTQLIAIVMLMMAAAALLKLLL